MELKSLLSLSLSWFLSCWFSLGLLTAATARTLLLTSFLRSSKHISVVVNKLDIADLSSIAKTVAELEDTCVTTRTISDLSAYFGEKLMNSILILEVAEDDALSVPLIVNSVQSLGLCNQRFNIHPQSLSLSNSCLDSLMEDQ